MKSFKETLKDEIQKLDKEVKRPELKTIEVSLLDLQTKQAQQWVKANDGEFKGRPHLSK